MEEDIINHPKHYTSHPSGIECIQITRHMCFNLGNAFKYIWRAGLKKDVIEDLEKAIWYIKDEIKLREDNKQGFNLFRKIQKRIENHIRSVKTWLNR